jgi:hypothetical protein
VFVVYLSWSNILKLVSILKLFCNFLNKFFKNFPSFSFTQRKVKSEQSIFLLLTTRLIRQHRHFFYDFSMQKILAKFMNSSNAMCVVEKGAIRILFGFISK